jgi:hypothetical protein
LRQKQRRGENSAAVATDEHPGALADDALLSLRAGEANARHRVPGRSSSSIRMSEQRLSDGSLRARKRHGCCP